MERYSIAVFEPYNFSVGQKINIKGGPRRGDWEVIGISERKVKLRCPVSHKEVEWDRFCYLAENIESAQWPQKE